MARKVKEITNQKDIDHILSFNEDTITESELIELFGDFGNGPKFDPFDVITIPKGVYGIPGKVNVEPIRTTVGLWIFNRYFIERDFINEIGYINETLTNKGYANLEARLTYALLEERISLDSYKKFINKGQKFMSLVSIISPSVTIKFLTCANYIDKQKAKLYNEKYKKAIDSGDFVAAEDMGNELIEYAKEYLKDDESLDAFDAGTAGSLDNNFKNMYVIKGAVKDPDPDKGYNIIMSNYANGISKEDFANFAKSLAAGPYSRANMTKDGGWWEKLFLPAYIDVVLDKKDSDCGTTRTIKYTITDKNKGRIMYNYIVENGKLVELTSQNINKYIGKTVRMRFSSLCEHEKICNKCAGNLFYRLNIMNVGTAVPQIASVLKNICMKNFHDSVVRTSEMDPMKAFGE